MNELIRETPVDQSHHVKKKHEMLQPDACSMHSCPGITEPTTSTNVNLTVHGRVASPHPTAWNDETGHGLLTHVLQSAYRGISARLAFQFPGIHNMEHHETIRGYKLHCKHWFMAELLIPFVMCTGRDKQITVLTTTNFHGKIHISIEYALHHGTLSPTHRNVGRRYLWRHKNCGQKFYRQKANSHSRSCRLRLWRQLNLYRQLECGKTGNLRRQLVFSDSKSFTGSRYVG
jgi:hypothetical protein